MTQNSGSTKWRRISDFYINNFPDTYVAIIIIWSFLWFAFFKSEFVLGFLLTLPLFFLSFGLNLYAAPTMIEKEIYPSQVLRFLHLRQLFLIVSIVCYPFTFLLGWGLKPTLLDSVVAQFCQYLSDIPAIVSLITWGILALINWSSVLVFMMLIFSVVPTGIKHHKMTRLSLLSAITGLRKAESQGLSRLEAVDKYVKWLGKGFGKCNDFLLQKPYQIGVKNISQYFEKVYSTTLVGRRDELATLLNYLENILKSVGKKEEEFDLTSFLMSLEKVNRVGVNQKESPQSLGEMIFVRASLLERFKGKIKSPYTTSVVAIVTLVVTIIAVVLQALK